MFIKDGAELLRCLEAYSPGSAVQFERLLFDVEVLQ